MSTTMNLLSSDNIDQISYIDLLKEIGAELEDQGGTKSVLTDGNAQIWICREDKLLDEYEEEDLVSVKEKLKAVPRCLIVLELGSDLGSSDLALKFVYAFGKKWHVVVDDLYEHVYQFREIENLYENGESFE